MRIQVGSQPKMYHVGSGPMVGEHQKKGSFVEAMDALIFAAELGAIISDFSLTRLKTEKGKFRFDTVENTSVSIWRD